jgi:hypothetical protein
VTTISTNILASGLISFRIYQAGRQITRTNGHVRAKRYRSLLWIYLESGSIYPTVLVTALALYFSSSSIAWLLIVNSTQICGMMPTLMILAVVLTGRSLSESNMTNSYTDTRSSTIPTRPQGSDLNTDRLAVTTHLSRLTDIEISPELHLQTIHEEYKSTGLISSDHLL